MHQRTSKYAELFLAVSLLFCLPAQAENSDVANEVNQILSEANVHNPQGAVKSLSRLGKPAVPLLIQKLPTYEFPTILISALGRIKDPDAVFPLLAFLQKRNLAGREDTILVRSIMTALADIRDRRAEPQLLVILQNQKVDLGIRLYSATVLAKMGSDNGKEKAHEFILNSPELQQNISKISPADLDTAYFEVGTKEAIDRLLRCLKSGLAYEQLFIIDLFSQRVTPEIIEALFTVSEDRGYFPDVRLRAVETLVREKKVPKDRILKALYVLREDAPAAATDDKSLVSKQQVDYLIKRLRERDQ